MRREGRMHSARVNEIVIDLSPAGTASCPIVSRRPKPQGAWWVVGGRDEEVVHFVRLPPCARTATLVYQAEGDWAIRALPVSLAAAGGWVAPVAAADVRRGASANSGTITT